MLKDLGDRHFEYFELEYLKWVYKTLTSDWHIVQAAVGLEGTNKWIEIFLYLELDQVAQMDLTLLAQQSLSGRACANEVLWEALTTVALHRDYEDLSCWVSHKCHEFRKHLDRPPAWHEDRGTWSWARYSSANSSAFSPSEVPPPDQRYMTMGGTTGVPLRPPRCWQAPGPDTWDL